MRRTLIIIFILFCFSMSFAVPRLVNYQGKLTNTAGVGINGTRNIQFTIFPAATGGGSLWTETHWNAPVTNGLFDVVLGSVNPINLDFAGGPYYLQISVNGDALIPRQQLVSEFFAIRAIYADSVGHLENAIMEGDNISLLTNDVGYITDADWDTLQAYSDTTHTHGFTDLTGAATDAQVPDNITVDFAAQAGAVDWGDITNIPPDIDDGDDFDTVIAHWGNLRNIPAGFADNIDNIDTTKADWDDLKNIPSGFADTIDNVDTTIAYWGNIRNMPPEFADADDAVDDNDWAYDTGAGLTGAIYHTGQVGIGVLSPEEQLHVNGNVKILGGMDFGNGFGDKSQVLTVDSLGLCDWQNLGEIGAIDLPDLGDVNTVGLVDGQVLKWIAIAGEWRPANDVGGTTGADNWGTQVVTTDTSLLGDGTPTDSLKINWAAVTDYFENTVTLSDLADVGDVGVTDAQVLTWVQAANEWRPVSIGPGGLGDNWGTQIIIHNNSIIGDGTPGNILGVNWDTLSVYEDSFVVLNDLQDVMIGAIEHDQVLAWDSDDSLWKPRTDNDADMDNELIDSLIWEPVDEDDTLWNTLRIVEHSIELDMFLPLDKDDISDNSINELLDVDTSGVEFCNLLHWDSTNWVPMSQQELFANHSIGDLGDVVIDEGDLEFGDFFIWWIDSTWSSQANVFDLLNLWADEGGYIAPVTETPGIEYVDFHIFEKDTTWGLYFYDQNDAYAGEWYGMYLARFGDAASDGYGIRSAAGTAEGIAPGSEFYGMYGEASGGSRVYGIYGDGETPGAGGTGYGVYGRGKTYGVYGYGTGSNSYGVYGKAGMYGTYGHATATNGIGIYGEADDGFAGYFEGTKSYFSGDVGIGEENPSAKLEVNGRIKDKTGYVMPVGTILPYGGSSAPEGWFLCNGSSTDSATYLELFNVIGYNYGGSGSSFNLPDLRGRIPVGKSTSDSEFDNLGETGGEKDHTLTIAEMPSHDHGGSTSHNGGHNHETGFDDGGGGSGGSHITVSNANCGSGYGCGINGWEETTWDGNHSHTIYFEGGNDSHNNIQPYQVVNYIIKY
ncbi:tail fiber protein [bacterium]|nr:tail fiber protein [bacterium]